MTVNGRGQGQRMGTEGLRVGARLQQTNRYPPRGYLAEEVRLCSLRSSGAGSTLFAGPRQHRQYSDEKNCSGCKITSTAIPTRQKGGAHDEHARLLNPGHPSPDIPELATTRARKE